MRELDLALFGLINGTWTCGFLDGVMPALTDLHKIKVVSLVLTPAAAGIWIYKARRRAAAILAALALAVGLSDVLAARLLKPLVGRPRPDPSQVAVILRAPAGGRYGFPSNHAANSFTAAAVLGSAYPAARLPLYAAAAVVAYSRVYVGVHYPSDVLGGVVLGLLIGWAAAAACRKTGLGRGG